MNTDNFQTHINIMIVSHCDINWLNGKRAGSERLNDLIINMRQES